jgi:sugar lactone lactonase YvrE
MRSLRTAHNARECARGERKAGKPRLIRLAEHFVLPERFPLCVVRGTLGRKRGAEITIRFAILASSSRRNVRQRCRCGRDPSAHSWRRREPHLFCSWRVDSLRRSGKDVRVRAATGQILVCAFLLQAASCAQIFGINDISYVAPDADLSADGSAGDGRAGDGSAGDASPPGAPSGIAASAVHVLAVTTLAGSGTNAFADGPAAAASFSSPQGVAVDGAGNVYVADTNNQRIRKIASGAVTTLAGSGTAGNADGTGVAAQFFNPYGIASDAAGIVYVADGNRIRKITSGVVTTLAGGIPYGYADGTGAAASFNEPGGVATDGAGTVYVADTYNNRIRKVTAAGVVTTMAGSGVNGNADGAPATSSFALPAGITVDVGGNVYVAELGNAAIRKVSPLGDVSTLAGGRGVGYADGVGAAALSNRSA